MSSSMAAAVASALAGVGLITTAVLLALPVLTIPALLIGPPPAEQLQLGLLVSLIMAVVIVGIGVLIWICIRNVKGEFSKDFFTPVDISALYWHLVDLIWIYLFPLLYLID